MGQDENVAKLDREGVIRVHITPAMKQHLNKLVRTGLFGNSIEEAASQLIARGIELKLYEGVIE